MIHLTLGRIGRLARPAYCALLVNVFPLLYRAVCARRFSRCFTPGTFSGSSPFVDDSPRDHIAEALEDCALCALNRDLLLQLVQQSPALGYQITTSSSPQTQPRSS